MNVITNIKNHQELIFVLIKYGKMNLPLAPKGILHRYNLWEYDNMPGGKVNHNEKIFCTFDVQNNHKYIGPRIIHRLEFETMEKISLFPTTTIEDYDITRKRYILHEIKKIK